MAAGWCSLSLCLLSACASGGVSGVRSSPFPSHYQLTSRYLRTRRLKQLFPVNFTPVAKGTTAETLKRDRNDRWMCPGCVKTLANNPKLSGACECGWRELEARAHNVHNIR